MSWNLQELSLWFFTSFVGAGIIKLLDLAIERYRQRNSKVEQKVEKIIAYLNGFGEITELFRFFAFVSSSIIRDKEGNLARDKSGNLLAEHIILEPEPQYKEAIEALKETDINSAIAQKVAELRIQSAEVLDLCLELDSSGNLNKKMNDLFTKAVLRPNNVLKNKDMHLPNENFNYLRDALDEASESRRELRNSLKKYTR